MTSRRSSLILAAAAAVLGAMLGSTMAVPAQARVSTDQAVSAPGSDAPGSDAASDAAQEALRDVRGLLEGEERGSRGLPESSVPTAEHTVGDATMALRELALTKHALRGPDLAEAESYLARPTDPAGPRNPDKPYGPEDTERVCSDSSPVCVHYVTTSNDAPSLTDTQPANGVPDYVEAVLKTAVEVHNTYVAAGYRAPKSDGMLGGGPETDIYIQDIGDDRLYGYCTSDEDIPGRGPHNAWAYCVVDDDYARDEFPRNTWLENLQVTIAHEYFHAVQFGYDITEDSWFLEATAAWVEDEVYTGVNDNVQYLRESPLRLPRIPMDTFGGSFHYGTWIFFNYLSERWPGSQGGLPTVVLDMVRKTDSSAGAPDFYSMQAVEAVLNARGADFPTLFAQFASANRRPAATYREARANRYPESPLLKKFVLGRGQRKGDTFTADHLTSGTVRFTPAAELWARTTRLRVQVAMAPAQRGSAAVAAIKLRSGKVRVVSLRIRANGTGAKTLPFSTRKVKHVELTLANAGTSYACFNGGPYSCDGASRNDDVQQTYRGTVRR